MNSIRSATTVLAIIMAAAFGSSHAFAGKITHDNVNVRSEPSTKGKSEHQLKKGDIVSIKNVGKKETLNKWGSHYWYQVTYSPAFDTFFDGWVFGAFIDVRITGNNVRLRSKPSTENGKIITLIKKNTKVIVLKTFYSGEENPMFPQWYYVKLPSGQEGWVHADYVG